MKGVILVFELESKARELAEIMVNSPEYKKYIEAKKKLEENGELLGNVNEYRKRKFYIQNNPDENMQNALAQLRNEFDYLLNNSVVRDFIDGELAVCKNVRTVTNILVDSIDMDMNFLN